MKYDGALRALWCAAKASGGTLRIGPDILKDYPGDKQARVTIYKDFQFGDLIVVAHEDDKKCR